MMILAQAAVSELRCCFGTLSDQSSINFVAVSEPPFTTFQNAHTDGMNLLKEGNGRGISTIAFQIFAVSCSVSAS